MSITAKQISQKLLEVKTNQAKSFLRYIVGGN